MSSYLMAETAASAPKPPLDVGSKFVGYEVRGLIGQGGHACVFHGYDSFMGQHVAIKVLYRPGGVTKEMMQRGQAEAQLLHRLRHPNIVEVSRAGIEDGLLFIVMELLRGRSLRTILEQEGRLAVEEVLFLSAQIADAAAAAHEQKAIHRDLKPDNVFITAENRVKVLDFGIAKLMDHAAWTTQKNIVLGTMLYMSPEQVQGLTLTPQSDIYALGLIMYTALFGRHPCLLGLENATFAELTRIQVTRNPPPLDELDPRIPSHVARLVGRAITKRPEERPASMRQFAADIRQSLERHVGETRQQHKVLQTRDLSHAGSRSAPGFSVQMPAAAPYPDATDTQPVSRPPFLGDVSAELAARVAALGPGGTAPLPRDVVLPPHFAPLTPLMAPPSELPPSTPPVAQDASRYGTPGLRRAPSNRAASNHASSSASPSTADKPTVLSVPASLKRALTPGTAPPVARQLPLATAKSSSSPPALGPAAVGSAPALDAVPDGVPRPMSPLRKAAIAGLALGALIGVGSGFLIAVAKPEPSSAAAPSGIIVEAITPQPAVTPRAPAPAPAPKPVPVESPAAAPASAAAPGALPPTSTTPPTSIAPITRTAHPASTANKSNPVGASDDTQQRLPWPEEDLKIKPAAKPSAKPASKSPPKPISVGSGLAF